MYSTAMAGLSCCIYPQYAMMKSYIIIATTLTGYQPNSEISLEFSEEVGEGVPVIWN